MDIAEHIRTDPEAGARRLCGNRADADNLYARTLERAVAHIAELC